MLGLFAAVLAVGWLYGLAVVGAKEPAMVPTPVVTVVVKGG